MGGGRGRFDWAQGKPVKGRFSTVAQRSELFDPGVSIEQVPAVVAPASCGAPSLRAAQDDRGCWDDKVI